MIQRKRMNHGSHGSHGRKSWNGVFRVFRVFRGSFLSVVLALSLILGQNAATLHDLGHALEWQKGGVPADKSCDTHYVCAQLGSAVGASAPALPPVEAQSLPIQSLSTHGAAQRTRLAYRSHAPPQAPAIPA